MGSITINGKKIKELTVSGKQVHHMTIGGKELTLGPGDINAQFYADPAAMITANTNRYLHVGTLNGLFTTQGDGKYRIKLTNDILTTGGQAFEEFTPPVIPGLGTGSWGNSGAKLRFSTHGWEYFTGLLWIALRVPTAETTDSKVGWYPWFENHLYDKDGNEAAGKVVEAQPRIIEVTSAGFSGRNIRFYINPGQLATIPAETPVYFSMTKATSLNQSDRIMIKEFPGAEYTMAFGDNFHPLKINEKYFGFITGIWTGSGFKSIRYAASIPGKAYAGSFSTPAVKDTFDKLTTEVVANTFMHEPKLTAVSLPDVKEVGFSAFQDAPLTYIDLRNVTHMGDDSWDDYGPFLKTVNADTTEVWLPDGNDKNGESFISKKYLDYLFGQDRYDRIQFHLVHPTTGAVRHWKYVSTRGYFETTGEHTSGLILLKMKPQEYNDMKSTLHGWLKIPENVKNDNSDTKVVFGVSLSQDAHILVAGTNENNLGTWIPASQITTNFIYLTATSFDGRLWHITQTKDSE